MSILNRLNVVIAILCLLLMLVIASSGCFVLCVVVALWNLKVLPYVLWIGTGNISTPERRIDAGRFQR